MEMEMEIPKLAGVVKVAAAIGALVGCGFGTLTILTGIAASSKFGFSAVLSALASGAAIITGSLVGLGLTHCFLAITKAQIEARNTMVKYSFYKLKPTVTVTQPSVKTDS